MKILIDARLYGLEHAGLGRYTLNLIEQLKIQDLKNEYVILLRKEYFETLTFPRNWSKVMADFRHYTVVEQLKLPIIIARQKPDIVHFPHMNVPKFYNGRFVVTVHDLLMQKHRGSKATTLPFFQYLPKLIGAKYVFSNAVKKAKRVIVPSKAVLDEVTNYYKLKHNKLEVTYEGVDQKFYKKNLGSVLGKYGISREYLIYSGSAYPHKNLENAINAVVQLNKLLVIVSSRNIFTQKLEEVVKKLNAAKNVRLLGFVPDDDLISLMKNSQAFIFPSLSEGFGLPGIEAMATGTLLLASDIPVFREVYKNIPLYFDPYSVESIKKTILEGINLSNKNRSVVIQKGIELSKIYSWGKMAQKTLQIYEQALKV